VKKTRSFKQQHNRRARSAKAGRAFRRFQGQRSERRTGDTITPGARHIFAFLQPKKEIFKMLPGQHTFSEDCDTIEKSQVCFTIMMKQF
jgi:hypothetical protein